MDRIILGNHIFDTLVAITEEEQSKGLMGRAWPPPIMCFPFKKASIKKFWMKNTPSPLDIVFSSNNKIISIENGIPFSTQTIGPNQPVDLVIELPAGTCKKLAIEPGQSVKAAFSLKTLARSVIC